MRLPKYTGSVLLTHPPSNWDSRACSDLEHHLDVEVRTGLQSLRLEQLPRCAQLIQSLGQFGAN